MSSSSNSGLEESLLQLIQRAAIAARAHTEPALNNLKNSQLTLEAELGKLDAELQRITTVLETVTLDPQTSDLMEQTRQCLRRTKSKLTTIRGRLGRLRMYEESDRLRLNSIPDASENVTKTL